MSMDEPLAKIVAGNWDAKAQAAERLVAKLKERKMTVARQQVYKPLRERDYKGTLAAIDEVTTKDPELNGEFDLVKFTALDNLGEVDAALALGQKLIETYKDQPGGLNGVAWAVVDPDRKQDPDSRLSQLALQAAKRADELTGGANTSLLDTLACALYRTGDAAGAAAAEEKALKLLEAEAKDRSHPYFEVFGKRLEMFRQAVKTKADRS